MIQRRVARHSLVMGSLIWAGGCVSAGYRANIQAPYSYDRIVAIREAGERRDKVAVPLLVDRLEDEDSAVRFYAILALERITGDRLGYRYEDSASERHDAVERWRQFANMGPGDAMDDSIPSASQPASPSPRARPNDRVDAR